MKQEEMPQTTQHESPEMQGVRKHIQKLASHLVEKGYASLKMLEGCFVREKTKAEPMGIFFRSKDWEDEGVFLDFKTGKLSREKIVPDGIGSEEGPAPMKLSAKRFEKAQYSEGIQICDAKGREKYAEGRDGWDAPDEEQGEAFYTELSATAKTGKKAGFGKEETVYFFIPRENDYQDAMTSVGQKEGD